MKNKQSPSGRGTKRFKVEFRLDVLKRLRLDERPIGLVCRGLLSIDPANWQTTT